MKTLPPNRIAELRIAKGLSQEALAEAAKSHWTTISKLERGKMALTDAWMARLARPLGVSPAEIMRPNRFVGSVSIAGRLREKGQIKLLGEDELETIPANIGFLNHSNDFWVEVQTDSFAPTLIEKSFLRCQWLDPKDYPAAVGRICFIETEANAAIFGVLVHSEKKDSRRRQPYYYVSWNKTQLSKETVPSNIAVITAIVTPF